MATVDSVKAALDKLDVTDKRQVQTYLSQTIPFKRERSDADSDSDSDPIIKRPAALSSDALSRGSVAGGNQNDALSQIAINNVQGNTNQSDGSAEPPNLLIGLTYEDLNEELLDENDTDFVEELNYVESDRPTSDTALLVEINLDKSGKKKVQYVNINGRCPTRVKNQGHHTVAFGLLGLAIKKSMSNRTYIEAVEGLALILGGKELVNNLTNVESIAKNAEGIQTDDVTFFIRRLGSKSGEYNKMNIQQDLGRLYQEYAEILQKEEKDESNKGERLLLSRTAIFRQDLGHATENVIRLWNRRPYAVYTSKELEIFRYGDNRERGALGNLREGDGSAGDAVALIDMVNYDEEKRKEKGINDDLFNDYKKIKKAAIDECLRLCEIIQPGFLDSNGGGSQDVAGDNQGGSESNQGESKNEEDRLNLPKDPSEKKHKKDEEKKKKKKEKKKAEKKQPEADKKE